MKILLDMNLSPRWVSVLRQAGMETHHWSEFGQAEASGRETLAFAAKSEFVVLTRDLDFSAILAATRGAKPSVVQIRAHSLSSETVEAAIISALRSTRKELEAGALLTIDVDRSRIRLLPLAESETE